MFNPTKETMKATFDVEPIGNEGKYAIIRISGGEKHYLSAISNREKIGHYTYEVARATAYAAKIGALQHLDGDWLPWPSDALPMRTTARFGASVGPLHRDSLARSPFRALLA